MVLSTNIPSAGPPSIAVNPCIPAILQRTWGWDVIRLEVMMAGRMAALFTAMQKGSSLISLPHFNHGGLWPDVPAIRAAGVPLPGEEKETAAWVRQRLMLAIIRFLGNTSLNSGKNYQLKLELNPEAFSRDKSLVKTKLKLQYRSAYRETPYAVSGKVNSYKTLNPDQPLTLDAYSASVRRKVRKAMRNDLETTIGGVELLSEFYGVYRQNIRELGSFGLPLKFFRNLAEGYKDGHCRMVIARHEGKPVGSAIMLTFGDQAENAWFATLGKYNRFYVSYLLHHAMIQEAHSLGCTVYCMGRSTEGSGVHLYKQQWASHEERLLMNATFRQGNASRLYPLLKPMVKHIPLSMAKQVDKILAKRIY